jgi:hypothetical protein
VIEHSRSQRDRRVREPVEGLRALSHLDRVAEALRVQEVQPVVRALLVGGEARRGRLSGPITFNISKIEPGQPCVLMIGSAFSWGERTWMKWMSSPSISVMKFGKALSRASTLPKPYSSAQ